MPNKRKMLTRHLLNRLAVAGRNTLEMLPKSPASVPISVDGRYIPERDLL